MVNRRAPEVPSFAQPALAAVIRLCLAHRPTDRPAAAAVSAKLFEIEAALQDPDAGVVVRVLLVKNISAGGAEGLHASGCVTALSLSLHWPCTCLSLSFHCLSLSFRNNEEYKLARLVSAKQRLAIRTEAAMRWPKLKKKLSGHRGSFAFNVLVLSGHGGEAAFEEQPPLAECAKDICGSLVRPGASVLCVLNSCSSGALAAAIHRHSPAVTVVYWAAAVDTTVAERMPTYLNEELERCTVSADQLAVAAAFEATRKRLALGPPGEQNDLQILGEAQR